LSASALSVCGDLATQIAVNGSSEGGQPTMHDGEFINTFLDNVRVPAESLVGKLNGGWEVLTGSLGTERGIVGAAIVAKLMRSLSLISKPAI
jgi:alkylation response protein AidB-like acyl-CoA dehydrogenase